MLTKREVLKVVKRVLTEQQKRIDAAQRELTNLEDERAELEHMVATLVETKGPIDQSSLEEMRDLARWRELSEDDS